MSTPKNDPFQLEQFLTQSASMTKEEMLEGMEQIKCKLLHPAAQGYSKEELKELAKFSVHMNIAFMKYMTKMFG